MNEEEIQNMVTSMGVNPDELADMYATGGMMNEEYLVGQNEMGLPPGMEQMEQWMPLIGAASLVFNILMIVFFVLKAWGLYNINKKLGEPYPWLAWIPLIQIYSFVKAGGKKGIWILWILLGFMAFIIPGIVLYIIVAHGISKRTGRTGWSTLGIVFVDFIMLPVIGHKLQAKTEAPTQTLSSNPVVPETPSVQNEL